MSPDLDPAVEAAARHIGELSTVSKDRARWFAERAITAAAPLIRAQERAAVRAELLAIADEFAAEAPGRASYDATGARYLADRIAPEHTTPREKP